jgi:protein-disulfide isomerase
LNSGNHILVAAVIMAVAIVAGAFLVKTSLDSTIEELSGVRAAVQDAAGVLKGATAPSEREARRPGPDPDKRYEIDLTDAPVIGSDGAKVMIVEFSDFQCPFCARVVPTLSQVQDAYGDEVRIAFKHFPLPIHAAAPGAAAAAVAAQRQGKFWQMHDLLFENQRNLNRETYLKLAGELGLDTDRFEKDLDDPAVKDRVAQDLAQANALQVGGTPGFFINGRFLSGAQPFAAFKAVIDEELKN